MCASPAAAGDAPQTVPEASAAATQDSAPPGTEVTGVTTMPAPGESARPSPDPDTAPEGYPWRSPPATEPNWRGAGRDLAYFLSYQIVGVAVLYVWPESLSGWSSEQKQDFSLDQWRENVSKAVWDDDKWAINYVLHPYWGAGYYTRARERGLGRGQSFAYSALMSALWEYGVEALAEPVSIQDLIVTPVLGSLLGEYVFAPWRERIRSKEDPLDWSDHAVLALTDPLGAINAKLNQWLGVKATMQLQPLVGRSTARPRDPLTIPEPGAPRRSGDAWRLQLRVRW